MDHVGLLWQTHSASAPSPATCRVDKPEWSSFTSDDIVFVIESAATRRSFRRFLGTPKRRSHFQVKRALLLCGLFILFTFLIRALCLRCWLQLTLSESLQHIPPHPCQAVLRCVGGGGASWGGAYGHGHGAAGTVTGRWMGGASRLGLQHINITPSCSSLCSNTAFVNKICSFTKCLKVRLYSWCSLCKFH